MFLKRCLDAARWAILRRQSLLFGGLPPSGAMGWRGQIVSPLSLAERLEERLALTATITLTTYQLTPNAANQTVSIYVSGGDAVAGVDLAITTGDGTPGTLAPIITGINLFPTGGVFASNNTGASGTGQATGGHYFEVSTVTASGNVNLGGVSTSQLLATVTLTTAAFSSGFSQAAISSGSYSISVGGTLNNGMDIVTQATDFPPETSNQVTRNPNFTDGVLDVGSQLQNATISVTGASVTYDGNAHPATATATGTMGEDLDSLLSVSYTNEADDSVSSSAPIQVGTYDVFASFAGNSTYNAVPSFNTGQTIVIAKANAFLTIDGASATYNGNALAATGTAIGVVGENLTSLLQLSYENKANSSVSASAPTQAGTYEVFASFAGNGTYNAVASYDTSQTVVIAQASAQLTIMGASATYDGNPLAATGTATGVLGENLTSLLSLSYENLSNDTSSASAPTQVGTYEVFASFAGNADYAAVASFDTSRQVTISAVGQLLSPVLTITGVSVMFDGNAHAAIATATGASGENLTSLLTISYKDQANDTVSASAPVQIGTYEILASFAGNSMYQAVALYDTNQAVVISKANAVLTFSSVAVPYDTAAHPATGTATGVAGANLSSLLSFSYTDLADNMVSTTAPTQAGTYQIFATFAGNSTYNAVALFNTNQTVVISKVAAVLTFNSVTAAYDSSAHPASASATGVAGEDLSSLLNISYSNQANDTVSTSAPTQTGTYEVFASFTGNNNYNAVALFDTSKTVTITAAGPLMNATLSITGASVVFDGNPHPATATATGANDENLTFLLNISYENLPGGSMSASPPVQVGTYEVFASFAGNSTYNADPLFDTGATIYVSKASPALNVSSAIVAADGSSQSAPVTVTSAGGQDLTSLVQLTYENLANNTVSATAPATVGTYEVFASFAGNSTYNAIPTFDTGQTLVITATSPLKATASGKLPGATLVAGRKIAPIHLNVKLTNTSSAAVSGPVSVSVVLSTSPNGTTSDTLVGKFTKTVKLKGGKSLSLGAATIKSLPAGTTGAIYVLVKLTDANGATNLTSVGSVVAAAPVQAVAAASVTAPAAARPGRNLAAAVTLVQNGNIAFADTIPVELFLSTVNTLGSGAISLGFVAGSVSIQPQKKGTLHLTVAIPSSVSAGQYFVIADIDPNDVLGVTMPGSAVLASLKKVAIS